MRLVVRSFNLTTSIGHNIIVFRLSEEDGMRTLDNDAATTQRMQLLHS